jgi:hypothetical protein
MWPYFEPCQKTEQYDDGEGGDECREPPVPEGIVDLRPVHLAPLVVRIFLQLDMRRFPLKRFNPILSGH